MSGTSEVAAIKAMVVATAQALARSRLYASQVEAERRNRFRPADADAQAITRAADKRARRAARLAALRPPSPDGPGNGGA